MNLAQLEQIVAIHRAGSITRAAPLLFLSQSALSKSVRALEQELGQPIFARGHSGVELTLFGERVMRRAEEMTALKRSIADLTRGNDEAGLPSYRVSASRLRFSGLVYQAVAMRHSMLLLDLQHTQRSNSGVVLDVVNGCADVGVLMTASGSRGDIAALLSSSGLHYECIGRFAPAVYVSAESPLFGREEDALDASSVAGLLLINTVEELKPFYEMYEQVGRLLGAKKVLNDNYRYRNGGIVVEGDTYLCSADTAALYEALGTNAERELNVQRYLLRGAPFQFELGLVRREDTQLSFVASEFVAELSALCRRCGADRA